MQTEINEYGENGIHPVKHELEKTVMPLENSVRRRAIIFMALINAGKVLNTQFLKLNKATK